MVYAGKDTPKDQLPFTVLRNDTLIQSISSNDSKITEVVFYQPNTELKTKEITLSASAPCTMLIEIYGNEKTISVNDPQMDKNLKQILLKLNGKILTIDMPQGELCGKPVTINI